mmetsp:Transcript_2909/g.3891  ORF Transcript_2909/g.3891 Transcript_2909/m.3891 type:complete len:270 (+) Transcript_2909:228-1037(+)|eukprot:CAMPEP_0168543498 /NCGR_PEP_ID=MMETSP0413-20121227/1914_1 /TAXON_ID=136452 /ORGANISM="Filamoeba nolandi, Strain NC-AS-23-1" /LENGTH=269 /DNA_ID=CAMNT_0008573447 /DNA_START=183 /DNA_END=992 /DNA_ORIENTATION=-
MMDSAHYREETTNTFFPSLLAFVKFSIWSLFNALFVMFVGHDSAFMDKFPSFHVELDQDETVTKPSIPIIETQYGATEECHQEVLTQEVVMYTEEASTIDAVVLQTTLPEKRKNNTRRKKAAKSPKSEVTQEVVKEQPKPTDEEWTVVASSKKTSNHAKLPKQNESKPKEQKKVESKKNSPKKEAQQPKPKVQKEQQPAKSKPSKVEAPVLPQQQPAPVLHSMLKRNYHLPVETPLVKPVRQPVGPPTSGGFGFSSEYRKSRMSAVMAH